MGAVSIMLFASWMGSVHGGYFTSQWALVVLILAVLMITASLAGLLEGAQSRWTIVAIGFFALYASWTFLSILWSPNRGDAWLGAGQTLLYLLAFWIVVGLIALNASRRWVLVASALGPAAVAAFTIPALSNRMSTVFEEGRLQGSVGYHNGEAAFLLVPLWVSIYLAGSRLLNPMLRSLVLAGAVLSAELAVLTQSRAMVVGLVISLPVFFVFTGQRLRGLLALAPVAVSLLIVFPDLNNIYTQFVNGGSPQAAISQALPKVYATIAAAGAYGLVWGLIDQRWRPSAALVRSVGAIAVFSILTVLVAGTIVAYQYVGNPVARAEQTWEAFRSNDRAGQDQSRYLSASGTGRYTLWQVAWKDFTSHPILGVGTHNYEATFYQEREKIAGFVRQPHMLPLEVLAERGLIGGVLFFGFLGTCLVAGLAKRYRDLNAEGKAQVGAIIAAFTYWFVHSSAEWFWQIPAVSLPIMIYLAILVAPWEQAQLGPSKWSLRIFGAAIAVAAIVSVAPLYAADFYLKQSERSSNPWDALLAVERAQRFNPVDARAAQREAELAIKIGDWPRAERALSRATRLNPRHYAPFQLLGLFYERMGQPERALSTYREALTLNPLNWQLRQHVKQMETELVEEGRGENAQ
jgi:tetratricopeptide (TPR) repeat protein